MPGLSARGTPPPNRWLRHAVAGVARAVLATIVGLLIWSVLPAVLGLQPTAVMSGSMQPAIRVGDVVLTREIPADRLRPGQVLLVADPADPARLLMHRLEELDDSGDLQLRGDANAQADSTPVSPQDVRGVGVLRVPWVGLPYVWFVEGRYLALLLAAAAVVSLLLLSPVHERRTGEEGNDPGDPPDTDGSTSPGDQPPADATPRTPVALGAVSVGAVSVGAMSALVVGLASGLVAPVSATFTDTVVVSASFTAGYWTDTAGADATPAGGTASTD